ncbi:MAG TPA: hypothetical protein VFZ47_04210 [Chitinophagaceae bacterium]
MKKIFLLLMVCVVSLKLSAQEIDSATAKWNFSAWAEMFIIPGEEDFFNPTFYARHKNLHLEGRYNYEDRNTASFWAGRRIRFGNRVNFLLVPMAGIVLGNTDGVAPGLEAEISFRKLDFYTEMEYVFDFETNENNFFYMYSELAIRPVKPLRVGMMAQRTKLFESQFDVERGVFAEYYFGRFRVGAFYFNPFTDSEFWIASVSVDF